jgi:hypothetical protein
MRPHRPSPIEKSQVRYIHSNNQGEKKIGVRAYCQWANFTKISMVEPKGMMYQFVEEGGAHGKKNHSITPLAAEG